MDLNERVERLERANHRLIYALTAVGVLADGWTLRGLVPPSSGRRPGQSIPPGR